jgi:hypothetical protein
MTVMKYDDAILSTIEFSIRVIIEEILIIETSLE